MATRGRKMKLGQRYHKPGTAPGTLRAPEERAAAGPVRITVIDYSPEKLVEKIGKMFNLHPLALEDVLNCGQRPKLEDYGSYDFLVMRSMFFKEGELETEQISFFLAGNFVITFQEVPGDSFEAVRERIRKGKGQIRKMGPDYLTYALVDALVDEFFPVLEKYGERIEELENEVILRPSRETIQEIHKIKRELLLLRRAAWPERDVINAMQREESDIIRPETQVFLRDCYDHTIQVIDMIETFRDLSSGMLEVYLSSTSNRLNEVMKVLTIFASIFIPLSALTGVYGMNLRHPEGVWYWDWPFVLATFVVLPLVLLVYFWRKGWIFGDD